MTKLCSFKDRVSICFILVLSDKACYFHFWVKQLDRPPDTPSWPSDANLGCLEANLGCLEANLECLEADLGFLEALLGVPRG